MSRILMVCLGNICRSPLAEVLLTAKVNPKKVEVDSAGTGNYHVGEPPDTRMIIVAKQHGLNDITNLRGRQFTKEDFENFDHIYAMDASNYDKILQLADDSEQREKVSLILNESLPGKNKNVPDPYFGDGNGFRRVYKLLDEATDHIAERLEKKD